MKRQLWVGLLFISQLTFSQKKVVDSSTFSPDGGTKWPSVIPGARITSDGKYIAYYVTAGTNGNSTTIVESSDGRWKKQFDIGDVFFTRDGKFALMPYKGDSLYLLRLGSDDMIFVAVASTYYLAGGKQGQYLVCQLESPDRRLMVQEAEGDGKRYYDSVIAYQLSSSGNRLLVQTENRQTGKTTYGLKWIDLQDGKERQIWEGVDKALGIIFDKTGRQIAFRLDPENDPAKREIWRYIEGEPGAKLLINAASKGIDSNLLISEDEMKFSRDGDRLFFKLLEKPVKPRPGYVQVDIWSYKDPVPQSKQLDWAGPRRFLSVADISGGTVIQLQHENEAVLTENLDANYFLLSKVAGFRDEYYWNPNYKAIVSVVSVKDGGRKRLNIKEPVDPIDGFSYPMSSDGRWLVYFDQQEKAYFSYDCDKGIARNISKGIPAELTRSEGTNGSTTFLTPGLNSVELNKFGVGGWVGDSTVLIYDEYDIWSVDPMGKRKPYNLTNGYGRQNGIRFRLTQIMNIGWEYPGQTAHLNGKLLLSAFNTRNKYSGFYAEGLSTRQDPELLNMGPWAYNADVYKADEANSWVTMRMSAKEPMNCFVTRDFRTLTPLSDVQPQKDYNWLTSELIRWKTFDGTPSEGILYKPEDFDPNRKYPVLFWYYEKNSDDLYLFRYPEVTSSNINIPYFIGHGYLVFIPDIHYKMGSPGESTVNCVASAAQYLSKLPFVDKSKMGIEGQSFGGYETNYLVTHTKIFAAAAEMAGPTDFISAYNSVRNGSKRGRGESDQIMEEVNQQRIGATLWQRPDLYIRNSPIFSADKVITPLLMMHSLGDNNVVFEQSLELYFGLRRLGKKVWLLQYDRGNHIIAQSDDSRDLTLRLTQFFDHYLKGAPPPVWMTRGVPARLKGIETGLQLDMSGVQP